MNPRYLAAAIILSLGGTANGATLPTSPAPPPSNERMIIFVSDLHMGVGRDFYDPTRWHPTEDFRWHAEFDAFLDRIETEGKNLVDLVLVGDILELWQTMQGDSSCQHGGDLGCSAYEAVMRASRVVEQHAAVFQRLGKFAQKGENRVTLLPGNHDVAFAFPEIRSLVASAIPDPGKRVRIAPEGYWRSADGRIIAEHGQQIGDDPNKFSGWPLAPYREVHGMRYLEQPWGEAFVQKIFNRVEIEYPTIDNLSSEAIGVKYAVKDLGVTGTIDELGGILRFLLFQQSLSQARQFLGGKDGNPPEWKLKALAEELTTSEARERFLAESFPPHDPLAKAMLAELTEASEHPEFTKDELETACTSRWINWKLNADADIQNCDHEGDLSAIGEAALEALNPAARSERFREYLDALRTNLPAGDRPASAFEIYVYGHTHKEHDAFGPFLSVSDATWQPQVINDGAWQRTATEEVFCAIARGKGLSDENALRKLQPEDLPACYPFVAIRPGGEAKLRYWVHPTNGTGDIQADCTLLPDIPESCRH